MPVPAEGARGGGGGGAMETEATEKIRTPASNLATDQWRKLPPDKSYSYADDHPKVNYVRKITRKITRGHSKVKLRVRVIRIIAPFSRRLQRAPSARTGRPLINVRSAKLLSLYFEPSLL